jgi:prepilin-type N-terminal cleavage/methylation domain-containing protein
VTPDARAPLAAPAPASARAGLATPRSGRVAPLLAPAEAGYTLIEIMAAVAVIGVLMSLMIWGAANIRRNALASGSRGTIESVKAAIDAYYNTYRAYPPDGYDVPVFRQTGSQRKPIRGSQCLIYYLGFPTAQEIEVGQEVRVKEVAPFLEVTAEMLSGDGDIEERLANPDTRLIDRFGNEIHYDSVARDAQSGTYRVNELAGMGLEGGESVRAPDPRRPGGAGAVVPRNKGAYDLWSNGIKMSDPTDDIGNWK